MSNDQNFLNKIKFLDRDQDRYNFSGVDCTVSKDCPKGYKRKDLVAKAQECGLTIKRIWREHGRTGDKNMTELCHDLSKLNPELGPKLKPGLDPDLGPKKGADNDCSLPYNNCPKDYKREELVNIAKKCDISVKRPGARRKWAGNKTKYELCGDIVDKLQKKGEKWITRPFGHGYLKGSDSCNIKGDTCPGVNSNEDLRKIATKCGIKFNEPATNLYLCSQIINVMENQDNKNKWSWDAKRRQYKKDLESDDEEEILPFVKDEGEYGEFVGIPPEDEEFIPDHGEYPPHKDEYNTCKTFENCDKYDDNKMIAVATGCGIEIYDEFQVEKNKLDLCRELQEKYGKKQFPKPNCKNDEDLIGGYGPVEEIPSNIYIKTFGGYCYDVNDLVRYLIVLENKNQDPINPDALIWNPKNDETRLDILRHKGLEKEIRSQYDAMYDKLSKKELSVELVIRENPNLLILIGTIGWLCLNDQATEHGDVPFYFASWGLTKLKQKINKLPKEVQQIWFSLKASSYQKLGDILEKDFLEVCIHGIGFSLSNIYVRYYNEAKNFNPPVNVSNDLYFPVPDCKNEWVLSFTLTDGYSPLSQINNVLHLDNVSVRLLIFTNCW